VPRRSSSDRNRVKYPTKHGRQSILQFEPKSSSGYLPLGSPVTSDHHLETVADPHSDTSLRVDAIRYSILIETTENFRREVRLAHRG